MGCSCRMRTPVVYLWDGSSRAHNVEMILSGHAEASARATRLGPRMQDSRPSSGLSASGCENLDGLTGPQPGSTIDGPPVIVRLNRQHGHREDCARNTPHPEPEDERDDDEDGIEGEPSGQSLALDSSRKQESYRTNGRSREFSLSRTRGPSSPAAMSDGCSRNGAADS